MSSNKESKIAISMPGPTLQAMCNFIAIAETNNASECLRELILHTLVTFEEEKTSNIEEVAEILKTLYGVEAPNHQTQETLDQLISTGQVSQPMGINYVLAHDTRKQIKARIDQASNLQVRVKNQWLAEISGRFPELSADYAWDTLQEYLAKAFLRHGIQVALFLDPSFELPNEYAESLSGLLNRAVKANFDSTHQESARIAISDFLGTVGKNPERAEFISECADGAANYYSLAVSPGVAGRFREKLKPLFLFCDTNFLFGILDLHVHPLVEVSNELLEAIANHSLPLKLRYHEKTLQELCSSIDYYGDMLRQHKWQRGLSRAATTSRFMSGIELKYHQKNADTGIDVDSFLLPYEHVDVLLKDRRLEIYKSAENRLEKRATLEAEYKEFLERINKAKSHELIAHDIAVLECVRFLRNNAQSTIESGALFITCDHTLYRFDSELSRKEKTPASVVLPNVLWQILRPLIPSSQDFDRSFAETFAIPEFRTIGSGASKACSKMLGLLSAYQDFPEETAARLLSNNILIDNLRAIENDEQFQATVDSAIAGENQALLEERAILEKQVESLQSDREQAEKELEEQKKVAAEQSTKAQQAIEEKEKEAEAKVEDISAKLKKIESEKKATEKEVERESELRQKVEARALHSKKVSSIIVAIVVCLIFLLIVHNLWRWDWLLNHPQSYGLQGLFCLIISCCIMGLWVRPWRNALWGTGVTFGLIFALLGMLGGPTKTP